MKGQHKVVVRNNKVQIKLLVQRNITILQGNSATGKTTLIDLISAYDQLGSDSGAVVECSQETYLAYRKSKLNEAYLREREFQALKGTLPDLGI